MTPSVGSTCSSRSALEVLEEQISMSALETLACRHGMAQGVTVQIPKRGAFNLVYPMIFPDGRKWVARIPSPESFDVTLMQSTLDTVQLIRGNTSIPIPAVHAHDTSSNNELGMPFVLMDFVEGVPLIHIWKDEKVVDDTARRRLFEQVAGYMSQLSALEFDKIGHLKYDKDHGTYIVGPYRWERYSIRSAESVVEDIGPFTTTHAFLSHLVQFFIDYPYHYTPIFSLLRLLALSLPDPQYDGPPFVLSHPDLDSQNVLVDPETMTVTGFIDWDGVSTGSRLGGFARYPAWITRDWDPVMYGWHDPESNESTSNEGGESTSDAGINNGEWEGTLGSPTGTSQSVNSEASRFIEESPDALQRHRELYYSIYSTIDPQNADITQQSHIFEALSIALHSPELASAIVGKLCAYVFNPGDIIWGQLLSGIETGEWLKSLQMKSDPGT